MTRLFILLAIVLLVEFYAYQAIKTAFDSKWFVRIYIIISVLVILFVSYSIAQFDRSIGQNKQSLITVGVLLLVLVPKIVIALFLIGEDVLRLFIGTYQSLTNHTQDSFLPNRRKFISQLAIGVAVIPFASIIYGIVKGRYDFRVIRKQIKFKDLPSAFDGFTLTHISDIHSGSFDNPEKIKYAIELINQQNTDIILFTGDIVNTHAHEMDDWIDIFKSIRTPKFGKYSVLGNHDYGEYVTWNSEKDKNNNFEAIKAIHPKIDFKLLLNEHVKIKKEKDEIALVGVENWGRGFKQAGNLALASKGLNANDFKILLSHDPSHWDLEVKNHPNNYQLTLSGHTHGMQFGIEVPGFIKWSPVQYVYKQWAGLYKHASRYIYVNRGFGYHAYPGRVGIPPEITVLELKKG